MKNQFLLIMLLILLLFSFPLFGNGDREEHDLTIYTYDSFVAEWGPGPQVVPAFEEKTGYSVKIISTGDAGQMVSRAILEKDNPRADILIGIDNNLLAKALDEEILEPYKPKNLSEIPEHLHLDPSYHVVPYDYGYFSIIYDSNSITNPPRSLEDLTKEKFADSLILMDPRTSSPGLGFLLWTIKVYGDGFLEYWDRLEPSILTITEGWDAGYGLFTAGEAPMVLSYTTSPAYHAEYEDSHRYKATVFNRGNYIQIEGMGIVKNARHRKAAEVFIDFALTEAFQSVIPLTNWMFPVLPDAPLPDSFSAAIKPETALSHSHTEISQQYEKWISAWSRHLSQ